MFKLNENYEVIRRFLKFYYIRYSPAETSTIFTPTSQIYINIPREDSVISLLINYLDLNSEVIKKADNSRYTNGNILRVVNLAPLALFSDCKLTSCKGKHLVDISHAHIVSLIYKLIKTSRDANDLSIGFDRSRNGGGGELAQNKNVKGKYHLKFCAQRCFRFCRLSRKSYLWSGL